MCGTGRLERKQEGGRWEGRGRGKAKRVRSSAFLDILEEVSEGIEENRDNFVEDMRQGVRSGSGCWIMGS